MYLFLAFLLVPIIEIALFIQIGGLIGLWPTLAIVVGTAFLGSALMRSQGRLALAEVQRSFNDMRDPSEPLAHGAMILVAGVLLITPGIMTDVTGFLLLIPGVRSWVMRSVRSRVKVQQFEMHGGAGPRRRPDGDIIDGDYREVDPDAGQRPRRPGAGGPSGWVQGPEDDKQA
ncbi:FxsA family protein [Chachezhania antarctica]|uniref:FxsA family protein n=1 Tax=Chachezhania antarctica TaxID=2340860 RepID=UPI000EB54E12|nr:FxsA family protein [Chachezhania antarctica]|tara:strand:- start:539 stop:1057 length:519 start_codon:yes stop_codon:yes gene_type:complete